jgi:cell division protein FtsB
MSDDASVDFYNKYIERTRLKLNESMNVNLTLETQLWIAKEQIEQLKEQNEKLEKKVKSLEKKVSE